MIDFHCWYFSRISCGHRRSSFLTSAASKTVHISCHAEYHFLSMWARGLRARDVEASREIGGAFASEARSMDALWWCRGPCGLDCRPDPSGLACPSRGARSFAPRPGSLPARPGAPVFYTVSRLRALLNLKVEHASAHALCAEKTRNRIADRARRFEVASCDELGEASTQLSCTSAERGFAGGKVQPDVGKSATSDSRSGTSSTCKSSLFSRSFVHEEGVEPSSLSAPEPKSGASASSATRARC
jgi:hypothetical protein